MASNNGVQINQGMRQEFNNTANTINTMNNGLSPIQQGSQPYNTPQQYGQVPLNMNYNNQYMAMLSASPVLPQQTNQINQIHQQQQQHLQQQQNCQFPDIAATIMQRLDSMDKKLSQLDTIQESITKVTKRLNTMDSKINKMESQIHDLEKSKEFDGGFLDEITKKQTEIDNLLKRMQNIEKENEEKQATLKADIKDLRCRSMRDNLIFYKIREEKDENCENKILDFIENQMHIDNAKTEIKLHRAHRIGTYDGTKTRPIVAKFAYYPDRERVRKAGKELKGSMYGVSEQFPPEIMETRRQLIPELKKARKEGKEAYIKIDKLYINKRLYNPENSGN